MTSADVGDGAKDIDFLHPQGARLPTAESDCLRFIPRGRTRNAWYGRTPIDGKRKRERERERERVYTSLNFTADLEIYLGRAPLNQQN